MQQIWSALTILFVVIPYAASTRQAEPSSTSKSPTLAQVWKLDSTYTDPKHGVTFQYPSVWQASTQFGYWPPALTDSFAPPIAGFAYHVGGFPREQDQKNLPYSSTNLEGVGIVYSAVDVASVAKCKKMAASLASRPKHYIVVFGGRSYAIYETGQGGMSQWTGGSLYATYANQTCYLFETDVALGEMGAQDDISALTTAQSHFIDAHLLNIIKSVQIVPRR